MENLKQKTKGMWPIWDINKFNMAQQLSQVLYQLLWHKLKVLKYKDVCFLRGNGWQLNGWFFNMKNKYIRIQNRFSTNISVQ